MNSEKKIFAKIYPTSLEMSQLWFIGYSTFDYNLAKPKKHKYYGQLNLISDKEQRIKLAQEYINCIERGENLPSYQGQRKIYITPTTVQPFYSITSILTSCLEQHRRFIYKRTYADYSGKLKSYLEYLTKKDFINRPIGSITQIEADNFLSYLQFEKKYSHKTINTYLMLLSQLWRLAISRYNLAFNPFAGIRKLKDNSQPYSKYPLQLQVFIEKTLPGYNPQLFLLTQLIYYGCIRISENRGLKMENINFETRVITIPASLAKSGTMREIIIPDQLYNIFKSLGYTDHASFNNENYLYSKYGVSGPVMTSYNYLRTKWQEYRKAFGIPEKYKLYGFKYSSNDNMSLQGINSSLQQRHNGHTSLEYTQRYNNGMSISDMNQLRVNYPSFAKEIKNTNISVIDEMKSLFNEFSEKIFNLKQSENVIHEQRSKDNTGNSALTIIK